MSGGQQLFGSNNLVVAGSEQENWAPYYREINRASERCESACCNLIVFIEPLNDLEIIGAGEIDGARVPFAKERDQPRAARGSDIIRNLQQAMNFFVFERWMFPELQQMRAANAPVYLAGIPRGIDKRHPAALAQPYQIGAAAELVHNNVEISKVAVN